MLAEEILKRLLEVANINKVFESGLSLDDKKQKYIKINTKKLVKGEAEDLDECIITLISDEEVRYDISAYVIIKAMANIEDGHCNCVEVDGVSIMKVIYLNEFEHAEDKKQIDIKFRIFNNVEK